MSRLLFFSVRQEGPSSSQPGPDVQRPRRSLLHLRAGQLCGADGDAIHIRR